MLPGSVLGIDRHLKRKARGKGTASLRFSATLSMEDIAVIHGWVALAYLTRLL